MVSEHAPPFVRPELELAMREIHDRTGLVFEDALGEELPKLTISWAPGAPRNPAQALSGTSQGPTLVGLAGGRWLSLPGGGRELIDATIEVNGTLAWPMGLERADGLAAVFVHELGHVVGLPHNADPASFMYEKSRPQQPTWTTSDVAELSRLGHQSGCRPAEVEGA